MKKIELDQASASLAVYARALDDEGLVITKAGVPVCALLPAHRLPELPDLEVNAERSGGEDTRESPDEGTSGSVPVTMYTDGGAIGNPGPGGYGVVMMAGQHRRELSGGFSHTTNNRMEIMAAIAGLEALKGRSRVTLYTDSQYLANAINKGWAKRWRANRWMRTAKDEALNPDLWERLLNLLQKHEVTIKWVRGHAGNAENERADRLAVQASRGNDLPPDRGYRG